LFCLSATNPVVPAPKNGSKTTPSLGQLALIGVSQSSSGYTAKCASGNGLGEICHTVRLFLPSKLINPFLIFLFLELDKLVYLH